MNTASHRTRNSLVHFGRRRALPLLGLSLAAGLLLPQDVFAGHRHKHPRHKFSAGHGVHRATPFHRAPRPYLMPSYRFMGPGHFHAPKRIVVKRDLRRYRVHYSGRVYHRGHGHHHDIYTFPRDVGEAWVEQPYAYCRGELYGRVHMRLQSPGFRLVVGW